MGCALILSDINGCNEIVDNGKNGWLVPVKNTSVLMNTMLEARSDAALTNRFASAIREKINSGYAQSYLWDCLLNEYKTQLAKVNSK
jgi:glycosyltransferase involved in cell wall biosynthesis